MAIIKTSGLSRSFVRGSETINALIDVNLEIKLGEFLAILGPSGSGKSTLMYILGLLDRQSSGSYWLDDKLTDELDDDSRAQLRNQKIGFVFQSFHLLPWATAERNVALPLIYQSSYQSGLSDKEVKLRAEAALLSVGLNDRIHHRPTELSGGQRQRVAIARALVNQPRILFADEPTGNLDSKSGGEILELFHSLHESGVTVIMVTHDQQIAQRAERKIRIFDGRIVEDTGNASS